MHGIGLKNGPRKSRGKSNQSLLQPILNSSTISIRSSKLPTNTAISIVIILNKNSLPPSHLAPHPDRPSRLVHRQHNPNRLRCHYPHPHPHDFLPPRYPRLTPLPNHGLPFPPLPSCRLHRRSSRPVLPRHHRFPHPNSSSVHTTTRRFQGLHLRFSPLPLRGNRVMSFHHWLGNGILSTCVDGGGESYD